MPQYSQRARLLWQLRQCIDISILAACDFHSDADLSALIGFYLSIRSQRYLSRSPAEGQSRDRSIAHSIGQHMSLNDKEFRMTFRMSKTTFNAVVAELVLDSVFQPRGGRRQTQVLCQWAVALYRFTHHGDAASVASVALRFGTNEGSVIDFTHRVILALLRMEPNVTYWPDSEERKQIAARFAEGGALDGCVGIIDGFHVVLSHKPRRIDGNDFFNRKECFSLNIQGICDDQKRIRHLHTGFPGRTHDSFVYKSSAVYTQPQKHFSAAEYLLADSAYPPGDHCIPLFKKEQGALNHATPEASLHGRGRGGVLGGVVTALTAQYSFNTRLAHVRVRIEHTFGILKCRFSSLRDFSMSIRTQRDEFRAAAWIRACVVLHNLMRPGIDDIRLVSMEQDPTVDFQDGLIARSKKSRLHPRRVQLMRAMGLPAPG